MDVKVLRLHELSKAWVKAAGEFIHKTIRTDLSGWVCQEALATRPTIWDSSYSAHLEAQASISVEALHTDRWYAIVGGAIVGVCCVSRGKPDRTITLFLVDESLSGPDQLKVSDTLALFSIDDMLDDAFGKRNFVSFFPDNSRASGYAKLCKFRKIAEGPLASKWEKGIKELRDNILERR